MFSAGEINAGEKICLECNREFTGIISNCPHDNSLLFTRMEDPFVGTTLANCYEIQSVIGQGGMGIVYRARHTLMERTVAIKMLQSQLISDSLSVKRFQHEAKAASKIDHPHVIKINDFGISPTGQPFIVMDYLEGISLADVIKKDGQLSVERTIRIITQACDALNHAHNQGVVHRDLKPTNIVLVTYDDEVDFVKVVDFGVAKLMNSGPEGQKLTQAGEVCGSPVYMSPEQCLGMELDPRSDIYSMGILIYETLTGKLPLIGKTMVDTMSKHINEMPMRFSEARPDLYIPERLEAIIFKALSKDPEHRPSTMDELKTDLEMAIPRPGRSQVLRTSPVPQPGTTETKEPLRLGKGIITALATLLLLAMGGITFAVLQGVRTPAPNGQKAAPTSVAVPDSNPPPAIAPAPTTQATKPAQEQAGPPQHGPKPPASTPATVHISQAAQAVHRPITPLASSSQESRSKPEIKHVARMVKPKPVQPKRPKHAADEHKESAFSSERFDQLRDSRGSE